MMFNFGKCKCLHTGHGNEDAQYTMGGTVLNTTLKEKDLGLTISADMKVSEQCGIAAAKGNQILGLIRRNIEYKEKELIIPLYKTIVRPHLEYCIQAWRPYRKKDIDMLERVQRRATKMIQKLRNISYEMRLKECGLTTLETGRLRGDQIEVFYFLAVDAPAGGGGCSVDTRLSQLRAPSLLNARCSHSETPSLCRMTT